MASIKRDTPFLDMMVSSSLVISSNVKPYWKPEQPPPCTKTRNFRSGLPSSAIRSATLAAALSVKRIGLGISVWMFSTTALMASPFKVLMTELVTPCVKRAVPQSFSCHNATAFLSGIQSGVICRQFQCGLFLACHAGAQLPGDDGALVHLERH